MLTQMEEVAADMRATAAQIEAQINQSDNANQNTNTEYPMYGQPYHYPSKKPWYKNFKFMCIIITSVMALILFVFVIDYTEDSRKSNDKPLIVPNFFKDSVDRTHFYL